MFRISGFGFRACLIISLLFCQSAALTHDSPEHTVAELTEELALAKTPELYYRRACAYRSLRKYKEAAADLRAALALQPAHFAAQAELASVLLAREDYKEAAKAADAGMALHTAPAAQAQFLTLRADALTGRKKFAEALNDINAALRLQPEHVDHYLKRSNLQQRLGQSAARVNDLAAGFTQTQAAVLEIEWIEALIAAGDIDAALERIAPKLDGARLKSSWLLRRGRCYLAQSHAESARSDLTAAVEEIDARLNPARPDPQLSAERTLAVALLKKLARDE